MSQHVRTVLNSRSSSVSSASRANSFSGMCNADGRSAVNNRSDCVGCVKHVMIHKESQSLTHRCFRTQSVSNQLKISH